MVNILLTNVHSFRNAGDAALTQVAVELLRRQFPECRITLLVDDPASYDGGDTAVPSFYYLFKRPQSDGTYRWRVGHLAWSLILSLGLALGYRLTGMRRYWAADDELALLLQAYFDADLVVSTAGGFLYSSGAVGLVYGVAVFTMLLAGAMGKPLYMLPQSLGPFHRSWERWLLRRLAARIRLMMVREQHSLDLLERIGVQPARCHLVPDMAFCLNVAPRPRATEWLTTLGVQLDRRQPKIGFTVINWGAENRRFAGQANYEAAVAALARHCVHRYQTQILLFVQVTGPSLSQNDAIVTCRLAHQLSDIAAHLAVVAPVPQPELLAASYGLMDVFVGTRMHSNIFAMVAGVPLLAIGYQPKTQGIMQMVGLHKWVVGIEQVRPAQLCAMFDQLWAERVEVRQQLARRLPELRGEVHRAMHRVVMDFRACRP